ncbi:hypothetical protein NQ314_000095 [Rhamnusium bicolor]|uniref:PiggyBac transposable element-derived protein domain-containing protein n=1 Tax=Rhamnusium bicolor TaxID=1586634 RepID=A0AAV8ZY83_9CUCU|nr:hypothetical protein NQ314_000095 [Rhamnusium bicolor]
MSASDNALSEKELAKLLEDDDFWTEIDGDDNGESYQKKKKGSALCQILNSGDTSDRDEEDYEIFSDHDSESEVEADPNEDSEEVEDLTDSTSENNTTSASSRTLQPHRGWYGKDRTKWSKEAPSGRKTLSHNIITVLPGLNGPARQNRPTSPLEAWKLLFTDDMIQIIVQFTNIKIDEIKVNYSKFKTRTNSRRKYLPTFIQNTEELEIRAFIGLLYMQGVFKSGHEDLKYLWATDGTDLFLAIASSTAFNCFSNSSLLDVAFFDLGSLEGGEFAGRFLPCDVSVFLVKSDKSVLRKPTGFF